MRLPWPISPPTTGTYSLVGGDEGDARITRSVAVPPSGWAEVDLVVP